jgi:hypothetical protein
MAYRPQPGRLAAPLAVLAAKAGAKAFQRYGFTEKTLITHWIAIMGESLGRTTLPLKLTFPRGAQSGGTLRVLAEAPAALELQHLMPAVIDRINATFGFPAVKALSIAQGPAARPAAAAATPAPLDPEAERALGAMLAPIADEPLRQSLLRLGRALYGAGGG